jgi:hypothetical protein
MLSGMALGALPAVIAALGAPDPQSVRQPESHLSLASVHSYRFQ